MCASRLERQSKPSHILGKVLKHVASSQTGLKHYITSAELLSHAFDLSGERPLA
jgi:hypothetical protein